MDTKPTTTAKDFFLYLATTIGLYVSTISFLTLSFAIVDKVFPLAGEYSGNFDGIIRTSISALIIFFPAFFYITWLIFKDLKANPDKKDIWVRKWMIFLNLFVAGLTIAIDLVVLTYQFLGGEDLSLRFFLKVFFVLGVAITTFVFYFYNLKRKVFEYKRSMNIFLAIISGLVFASIIYGIMLIGSPAMQRAENLDAQRVNDLASIQTQIVYTQWENKGSVPTSTDALADPISGFIVPKDPKTGVSYEYKALSKNGFELCATFETSSAADTNTPSTMATSPTGNITNDNWGHSVGRVCFNRTIDPSLYKVTPTPTK